MNTVERIVSNCVGTEVLAQIKSGEKPLDDILDDAYLYDALYEHYLPEMPYGTAKARTGDPGEFVFDSLVRDLGSI